jgi:hypothetical protein
VPIGNGFWARVEISLGLQHLLALGIQSCYLLIPGRYIFFALKVVVATLLLALVFECQLWNLAQNRTISLQQFV